MRTTLAQKLASHTFHTLPNLPYGYDALEPYFDARTMNLHHNKHHKSYVVKLNEVLEKYPGLQSYSAAELLENLAGLDVNDADRTKIRNSGGGHVNHSFFWTILGPKKVVNKALASEINGTFGSTDDFKKRFTEAAVNHFGSGWAWLVRDRTGKLQVYTTANQDSPLMQGHEPVIGLDLWEHAYYLKYQDRRPEYIKNWWHVLKLL